MSNQPLKILSVFHGAVSRSYGRLRYHPFASIPDLKVHLLAPERWSEYGRTIIADPAGDPGVTLHIEPIRLPHLPAVKWYAHYYPRLKRIIEVIKPDVIHLLEEPWSFVALHASLLRRKAALVLEVDQNILKRLPQPFQAIRRHVLRQTDVILARSEDAATVVRACGFVGPVKPVAYGVDRSAFSPSPSRAPRPEGAPLRIGYVGRLLQEKGICDALAAMSLARSPIEFSMMGDGDDKELFNRKIKALGLEHRVSFRGWSNSQDVAAFLRSQDVSLLLSHETPSWREQFGRVIIESQSCGVPVIGAATGSIPNVVGEGGWIVPQQSPKALASLFDHLFQTPGEIVDRGAAGIANVASRFTYEKVAGDLSAAWREANAVRSGHDVSFAKAY